MSNTSCGSVRAASVAAARCNAMSRSFSPLRAWKRRAVSIATRSSRATASTSRTSSVVQSRGAFV